MLGQTRSYKVKFPNLIFCFKCMPILSSVILGFKKRFFYVRRLEMQKWHFKKVATPPLSIFGNCTTKNKYIALKLCMRVICMYLNHMYSVFLENFPRF